MEHNYNNLHLKGRRKLQQREYNFISNFAGALIAIMVGATLLNALSHNVSRMKGGDYGRY